MEYPIMREDKIKELYKNVRKSLKSFGYNEMVKVIDREKVSFILSKTDKGILVTVSNSHNSYIEYPDLYLYRQVVINLVKTGYEISMNYPCGIMVTDHIG